MALVHGIKPIVTSGLVLCLDAANRKSYPGSGTTWTDLSGNGITGTLTNMEIPGDYTSTNGGILTFDGTNEYVAANTSLINRTSGQEITVSCWIKPSRTSGQYGTICGNVFGNFVTYNWLLYQHTDNGAISFHSGNNQYKSSYIPTINVWVNATHTVTSSGVSTLYVNGVSTQTFTGFTYGGTPGILGIGAVDGGFTPFQGDIAQASIYNRALTATEIAQNYNALKGRYGLS